MYQYYTVLGCEYEITMVNPNGTVGADVLIATDFDSYTDAESSAENQTPDANLYDLMAFKKMKFKKLSYVRPSSTDNTYVLQGRYKQGMIKHNVRNDSDAKTWTDIDTTGEANIPSLNDMLNIRVFKHPLAYTSAAFVVNFQIRLKYIVQFKDLKLQARWPNDVITNQDISITLNETRTNTGTALQHWG